MKVTKKVLNFFILAALSVASLTSVLAQGEACGCPPVGSRGPAVSFSTLADAQGNLTAKNTVLTCDKVYLMDKPYYVGAGKTITIQPGSVIKGSAGSVANVLDGGNLTISRGGKIIAAGTESCPIIFTAELDVNVNGTYGVNQRGKWGGVVILGTATNNLISTNGLSVGATPATNGVGLIEGYAIGDSRGYFGAGDTAFPTFDDNDNSGIMTYVSLRHGGEVVAANREINGLTLGSVGRGTTLRNIEVVANADDGIEFFGGTVDLKYASVLFCDDDAFDWDCAWNGRGQFWVAIKTDGVTSTNGDHGFESDGDDDKINAANQSNPTVYNATYVGSNLVTGTVTQKGRAIELKEQTKGIIRNSILAGYKTAINFADDASRPSGLDANDNFLAGTLKVDCNTFVGNTEGVMVAGAVVAAGNPTYDKFIADGNTLLAATPGLPGFDFSYELNTTTNVASTTNVLDMNPTLVAAGSSAANGACAITTTDGFFTPNAYRGAFEAGKKSWLSNYSYNAILDIENGLVPCGGDLNTDGVINTVDFLSLLGVINSSCD
jgi:trimeric autotransporter adhesin